MCSRKARAAALRRFRGDYVACRAPRDAVPAPVWAARTRCSREPNGHQVEQRRRHPIVVHGALEQAFEEAWSLKELALRLHVSCQTLYDVRSQGRGPKGFRVGRELRFRASEADAWLARLEAEDTEQHPSAGQR